VDAPRERGSAGSCDGLGIGRNYAAVAGNAGSAGIDADHLLLAVASLCHGANGIEPLYAQEMVDLLVDGLRYRESTN
jgi:hypothetical protein